MITSRCMRDFSVEKHAHGQWNTRVVVSRNPLVRAGASYCSRKRAGVDRLAKEVGGARFVLDAGAGTGAYSHWYLGRQAAVACIAVDWSEEGLRRIQPPACGKIFPVCADLRFLPFQSGSIDALFSVDVLGHIEKCASALDEFFRVCKNGSLFFLHSECRDYQNLWPDRELIKRLNEDMLAHYDGHRFLMSAAELYTLYSRRFEVRSFLHPAGYCGFLLGYPEKYRMVFVKAHWRFMALAASVFTAIKKTSLAGALLRIVNSFTNHCEAFLGLKGGGSCFARLRKP